VGVLTRADLLAALAQRGPVGAVGHIMRRDLLVVDSFEMLEPVFMRLQEQGLHTAPVVHRGQLVGLLTSENVGEFLMIQAVLGQRR
jgi:CBS domain-containing protein